MAQVFDKSLSAFTGVIREYLDPVLKADRSPQYFDDIGVAAHTESELIQNLDRVFKQSQKAGMELSIERCHFGEHSIKFLGNAISSVGFDPNEKRETKILKNLIITSSVKTLKRYLGFVNFFRQNVPRLAEVLVPLHLLLRKDVLFKVTQQKRTLFLT